MNIIGIDPGVSGGLVSIDSSSKLVALSIGTDPYETLAFLQSQPSQSRVFIEKAQVMPKNGAVGMFNYGQGYGQLLGILISLNLSFETVQPRAWTKEMHIGTPTALEPKKRSELIFKRLWPSLDLRASPRCKNNHLGLIDAILIAEYGRRIINQRSHRIT